MPIGRDNHSKGNKTKVVNYTTFGTEGLNQSINNDDLKIIKEFEREHDLTLVPNDSHNDQNLKPKDSKLPLNEYESDKEQNDFRTLAQKSKFSPAPKLAPRNDLFINQNEYNTGKFKYLNDCLCIFSRSYRRSSSLRGI